MPIYIPNNYAQTVSGLVSANTTITSTTFTNLLSLSITTSGGTINCFASISSSNTASGGENFFRILFNGASIGASASKGDAGTLSAGISCSNNISATTGFLAPGTYSAIIQWRVSAGTGQVRPVAAADQEFCSLVLQETLA